MASVVVVAGQSNAQGSALESAITDATLLSARADIPSWVEVPDAPTPHTSTARESLKSHGDQGFGVELSMSRRLVDTHAWDLVVVKVASSNENIAIDWAHDAVSGAQRWAQLKAAMVSAITGADTVTDLVWIQGESDCVSDAFADPYATNLTALIAAARAEWGAGLRVWVCMLSPHIDAVTWGAWSKVRQHQRDAARTDDLTHIVDLEPYALQGDDTHYTADALVAIGEALADLIAAPPTKPRHGWRVFQLGASAVAFADALQSAVGARPSDPSLGGNGVRQGGGRFGAWPTTVRTGEYEVDSLGQRAVRIDEAAFVHGGQPHQEALS